jgi:hypothetical protein
LSLTQTSGPVVHCRSPSPQFRSAAAVHRRGRRRHCHGQPPAPSPSPFTTTATAAIAVAARPSPSRYARLQPPSPLLPLVAVAGARDATAVRRPVARRHLRRCWRPPKPRRSSGEEVAGGEERDRREEQGEDGRSSREKQRREKLDREGRRREKKRQERRIQMNQEKYSTLRIFSIGFWLLGRLN